VPIPILELRWDLLLKKEGPMISQSPHSHPNGSVLFRLSLLGTLSVLGLPGDGLSQALSPIQLRSAESFVVLAGSLISNISGSALTGDIGLSPAAGSGITGFTPQDSISGIVYTVDASGPAGSIPAANSLANAKGDLVLAYNDAAARTPIPEGSFLNPGAGSIGGMTLASGLYKFTSGLSIVGSDLTLSGNEGDVWIFQIGTDLIVGQDTHVLLTGGAQSSNVFWQVGTSATLGTHAVFKGTILADQSITLNSGASLEGRALAATAAVTLSANSIVLPELTTSVRLGRTRVRHDLSKVPLILNQTYNQTYGLSESGVGGQGFRNLLGRANLKWVLIP
jgi:Ice-binding-like